MMAHNMEKWRGVQARSIFFLYFLQPKNVSFFNLVHISEKLSRQKELSLCHKLKLSDSNIFATRWRKNLIFQT